MSTNFEKRADNLLRAIERVDSFRTAKRRANLRSTELKYLDNFEIGDPVFMTLISEEIDGLRLDESGVIAGQLADPQRALIDVRFTTTDMSDIVGKRIGLAVDTKADLANGNILPVTFQTCVAGNQNFAYYHAEDAQIDELGELRAPSEKITHKALKYGRFAVKGTVLFDFVTPYDKL